MIAVKPAGGNPLLIEIFIRNDEKQMPVRLNQLPLFVYRLPRIAHVLQTMRRKDKIEFFADKLGDFVGVTVIDVEFSDVRGERIIPAVDIDAASAQYASFQVSPIFFRFACFCRGLSAFGQPRGLG
jgi:hypothetical protein